MSSRATESTSSSNHLKSAHPRVLIVVENAAYPADRRVSLEAAALRDRGYDVTVVSPKGRRHWTAVEEVIDGILVYRFPVSHDAKGLAGYLREYGEALLGITWLCWRVQRSNGFDVLQVCNPPDLFFVLGFIVRILGKRFVFDQHDLTPETFVARFGDHRLDTKVLVASLRVCEWLTYRAANVVLATNESLRAIAVQRGGVKPARVFVVRNGPNEQRLTRVGADPSLKRGRAHLVCYVGIMNQQDGVDYALRAIDWIVHRSHRTDISFAFLGDGDSLPDMRRLASDLKLEEYIEFTGLVNSATVMRYLCSSDVGLAPEPMNGLNEHLTMIKVMEYMAVGLPIVAFDLTETRFSAQEAAVYATPNDSAEMGRLTLELLDEPDVRRKLGELGRARVLEVLSWAKGRDNLYAAYQAALVPEY